jgi:hypothetical protein
VVYRIFSDFTGSFERPRLQFHLVLVFNRGNCGFDKKKPNANPKVREIATTMSMSKKKAC